MKELEGPEEARKLAEQVHRGQTRKGKDIPYTTHLDRVDRILSDVTDAPWIHAAAWLHDSVEDGDMTLSYIQDHFGLEVMFMVQDVTEPDQSLPWAERKRAAEDHIPEMSHASLLLKTADVIANTEETTEDYKRIGDRVFDVFNAPKDDQVEHKKRLVKILTQTWPGNPLLLRLRNSYSQFLKVCNSGHE